MSNPYGPHESADIVWQEKAILVGDAISLVAYGITSALFILCTRTLFITRSLGPNRLRTWLLASYISVMFCLATIFVVLNTRSLQMGLIDNRNYPGGPVAYWTKAYSLALTVVPNAASVISSWLADALLLYRCCVIFSEQRWIVAFPAVMYLGSFSMGIMVLYQTSRPDATLWSNVAINFGLPYFIITISLNVVITSLIAVRLLVYRYRMAQAFPDGNASVAPYASIATLLIESSTLYAIFSLLFIGPYAAGSHLSNVFLPILTQVQTISPLLIILRVADRRAWTAATATHTRAPLQFGRHTDITVAEDTAFQRDVENGMKLHFSRSERDYKDDTTVLQTLNSYPLP